MRSLSRDGTRLKPRPAAASFEREEIARVSLAELALTPLKAAREEKVASADEEDETLAMGTLLGRPGLAGLSGLNSG